MIRQSLDPSSKHASVFLTPGNGVAFQSRSSTGGSSYNTNVAGRTAPEWVAIVRTGDTFKSYYSPDGASWTYIGSQTITMTGTVYIGLAVSSHDGDTLATATFDNVTATP